MFRFLRKYNKWILVVGGTLLMITFLIPFAFTDLQKMSASGGGTWATFGPDRQVITQQDANRASTKFTIARQWLAYADLQRQQQGQLTQEGVELIGNLMEMGRIQSLEHWFLLVKNAESLGLVGGPSDAYQLLGSGPDADALINAWAAVTDPPQPQLVREALADLRGIGRLLSLYRDSAMFSERRLREEMKFMYHTASANVVLITASDEPNGSEPTDAELTAQLNQFADRIPGDGERGFGYKLPDRVKLEWLIVAADSVRDMLPGSEEMSNIALRRHWRENPHLGEPSPNSPIPDLVRNDLLEQLTAKKLGEIAEAGNRALQLHRRGLSPSQGLLALPEGWSDLSFESLAATFQNDFKIALPSYESRGDQWMSLQEVTALPGVGEATTTKLGDRPIPLPNLIFNSQIFNPDSPLPVQVGIAPAPLRDANDNIYFVRVLAADPTRVPSLIDEVRDQVTRDIYRIRHYDDLASKVDAIRTQALDDGLMSLALEHDTRVYAATDVSMVDQLQIQLAVFTGQPLRPVPSALPEIGPSRQAIGGIIRKAMSLPLGVNVESLPIEERTIVVPVDDSLAVMVATITGSRPVARELLPNWVQGQGRHHLLVNAEVGEDTRLFGAFSLDSLKKRLNFAYPGAIDSEAEAAAPTTQASARN